MCMCVYVYVCVFVVTIICARLDILFAVKYTIETDGDPWPSASVCWHISVKVIE